MPTNPILAATVLRAQNRFEDAIQLIEDSLSQINDDYKVLAYREAFLAACDSGNADAAKKYARLIAETDPELPSIQEWL